MTKASCFNDHKTLVFAIAMMFLNNNNIEINLDNNSASPNSSMYGSFQDVLKKTLKTLTNVCNII